MRCLTVAEINHTKYNSIQKICNSWKKDWWYISKQVFKVNWCKNKQTETLDMCGNHRKLVDLLKRKNECHFGYVEIITLENE